jgi:hypothetical protein
MSCHRQRGHLLRPGRSPRGRRHPYPGPRGHWPLPRLRHELRAQRSDHVCRQGPGNPLRRLHQHRRSPGGGGHADPDPQRRGDVHQLRQLIDCRGSRGLRRSRLRTRQRHLHGHRRPHRRGRPEHPGPGRDVALPVDAQSFVRRRTRRLLGLRTPARRPLLWLPVGGRDLQRRRRAPRGGRHRHPCSRGERDLLVVRWSEHRRGERGLRGSAAGGWNRPVPAHPRDLNPRKGPRPRRPPGREDGRRLHPGRGWPAGSLARADRDVLGRHSRHLPGRPDRRHPRHQGSPQSGAGRPAGSSPWV